MNIITKAKMYELLEEKLNIQLSEVNSLIRLVDDIYNLENNLIVPLDEQETFIFRKHYGVLDNGSLISKEEICKKYNVGYQKYQTIMERIFIKFSFRIRKIDKYEKVDKMDSLKSDNVELTNLAVSTMNISLKIKNKLMKKMILTLKDLMEYSINELKNILGIKELEELVNYIHSLNINFLDELSSEERKEVFSVSSRDKIINSSLYWIKGIENIPSNQLNRININNIGSLIKNIYILPTKNRLDIMQFLTENDLSYLGREEESKSL